MVSLSTIEAAGAWLSKAREKNGSVGFVPTMGALHRGHLELVRRARKENPIVACSIFINPIQFNNPDDLAKYPRTLESDQEKLRNEGCDLAFVPSVREMYPEPVTEKYDFGNLEKTMEGKFRPGHFNGVAIVVKRLLDIVKPDRAYFGMKDYQQLKIIQAMVRKENLPVEVVPCPTVREDDGLAMSSRNVRLTPEERKTAPVIFRTLSEAVSLWQSMTPEELREWAAGRLNKAGLQVEYFDFADAETLDPVGNWDDAEAVIACVACFLGRVRLIDNMILFSKFAAPERKVRGVNKIQ